MLKAENQEAGESACRWEDVDSTAGLWQPGAIETDSTQFVYQEITVVDGSVVDLINQRTELLKSAPYFVF